VSYLLAFAPWLVFAVIPSGAWAWGAVLALAVSLVGIVRQTRGGLPLDAQIIAIGSAVYFAALAALAFAEPHTKLHGYTPAMASGALALIGLASLAARKPFTLGIAKQDTPREYWDNPIFLRVNDVITGVWTASFVIGAVVLSVMAHSSVALRTTVQVAAFVVPMVFTVRYVATVKARAEAAEAAAEAAKQGGARQTTA
jgi:hypothetical protein